MTLIDNCRNYVFERLLLAALRVLPDGEDKLDFMAAILPYCERKIQRLESELYCARQQRTMRRLRRAKVAD